ncbi:subtilase family protein [Striga asiatica]|uniref:Subtilase family protein n=1 Tax=Striga asiatica TaxID=4170 RepID=A0A5A7PEF3_STRAF|nr:subtilase family protein [Striga asiatica]
MRQVRLASRRDGVAEVKEAELVEGCEGVDGADRLWDQRTRVVTRPLVTRQLFCETGTGTRRVNIIVSWSAVRELSIDTRRVNIQIGTLMSCPRVRTAMLKAAIRSTLIHRQKGHVIRAGHVNPISTLDPSLVYNSHR